MAVKSRYPEVNVVIAGDGPNREEFLNALKNIPIKVEYMGVISGFQKKVFWRKIGVLASFAPTESFGRSIRESLFNYTPVIAKESPEILELQRTFGGELIAILGKSPTQNANKFATILDAQFSENDISFLKKEQVEAVNRLCDSWMRITN
jgi:glycosyltransferase involved in cell wall biosynthesis